MHASLPSNATTRRKSHLTHANTVISTSAFVPSQPTPISGHTGCPATVLDNHTMERRSGWPPWRARLQDRLVRIATRMRSSKHAATMSTTGFVYAPLDPARRQIRLLKLLNTCDPIAVDQPLHFDLVVVSLDDWPQISAEGDPPYYAMSYAWNEDPQPVPMMLNERQTMVPDSAYEALRGVLSAMHKADLSRLMPIWIDAVCINQNDPAEVSCQIAVMGDIYGLADVLIWLGEDDDRTHDAIASLQVVHDDARKWVGNHRELRDNDRLANNEMVKLPYWGTSSPASQHKIFSDLSDLLSCRWFTRLWIVQEVSLARARYCFRGSFYVPWQTVALAALWTYHRSDLWPKDWNINPVLQNLHVQLIVAKALFDEVFFHESSIGDLLCLNLLLQTKVPHDRIFALLGTMKDRDRLSSATPDYDRSLQDVYAEATHSAIASDSSLAVLSPSIAARENSEIVAPGWPSWVPRYHALDVKVYYELMKLCYPVNLPRADNKISVRLGSTFKDCVLEVDGLLVSDIATSHAMSPTKPSTLSAHLASTIDSRVLGRVASLLEAKNLSQLGLTTSRADLEQLGAALCQLSLDGARSTRLEDLAAFLLFARRDGLDCHPYSEQLLMELGAYNGNAAAFFEGLEPYLDLCR